MAQRKVSFLIDVDSTTQPGLMCRINIILLLILNCLCQPKRDWLSTLDTDSCEATPAEEVQNNTIKAVGGHYLIDSGFI